MGPHDPADHAQVGDPIGVVAVEQRAGEDRLGQVEGPAAVGVELEVEGEQPALVVVADPVAGEEGVALAGQDHVEAPVEADPDRAPGDRGPERRDGGVGVGLDLLATEGPAHAQGLDHDRVGRDPEHPGDDLLGLRRVLGRAVHEHPPVFVRAGQGRLGLQIEVLLAGDPQLAVEPAGGAGEGPVGVAGGDRLRLGQEALAGQGRVDADDRGQRLGLDDDRGRAFAGGLERLAEHPDDRLGVVLDLEARPEQQGLVVADRPDLVLTGDLVDGQDRDHAGDRPGRGDVDREDPRVGDRRQHRPGVDEGGVAIEEVVGVARVAADVTDGALVRAGAADLAHRTCSWVWVWAWVCAGGWPNGCGP